MSDEYNGSSNWATHEMYQQLCSHPGRVDTYHAVTRAIDADEVEQIAREIFDSNGGTFGQGSIETEEEFNAVNWQEIYDSEH